MQNYAFFNRHWNDASVLSLKNSDNANKVETRQPQEISLFFILSPRAFCTAGGVHGSEHFLFFPLVNKSTLLLCLRSVFSMGSKLQCWRNNLLQPSPKVQHRTWTRQEKQRELEMEVKEASGHWTNIVYKPATGARKPQKCKLCPLLISMLCFSIYWS